MVLEDAHVLSKSNPSETKQSRAKARASVIFTLEGKRGKKTEYIGLLDMGSAEGIASKELVNIYGFKVRSIKERVCGT